MFFLTGNILSKIIERNIFFRKPLALSNNFNYMKNIYDPEYPVILLVRDILYCENEKVLGLELFDGSKVKDQYWWTGAILDKSKWYSVHRSFTKNIPEMSSPLTLHFNLQNERLLKTGSVIILVEYFFENIYLKGNIDELNESSSIEYIEDVLCIKEFVIIGQNDDFENTYQFTKRSFHQQ